MKKVPIEKVLPLIEKWLTDKKYRKFKEAVDAIIQRMYQSFHASYPDLTLDEVQAEGYQALINAVSRWRPNKKTRLLSYFYTVLNTALITYCKSFEDESTSLDEVEDTLAENPEDDFELSGSSKALIEYIKKRNPDLMKYLEQIEKGEGVIKDEDKQKWVTVITQITNYFIQLNPNADFVAASPDETFEALKRLLKVPIELTCSKCLKSYKASRNRVEKFYGTEYVCKLCRAQV